MWASRPAVAGPGMRADAAENVLAYHWPVLDSSVCDLV